MLHFLGFVSGTFVRDYVEMGVFFPCFKDGGLVSGSCISVGYVQWVSFCKYRCLLLSLNWV